MKSKLLLMVVPALLACTTNTVKKNDLIRFGYHGPVKQIVSYKYLNYTGTIDSANFDVRTLFDYNEAGNVHFMQMVINRSMINEQSIAVNFNYRLKDGVKTGWQEININAEDTSYGTFEWLNETRLFERKYNSDNQVVYEITTELNPETHREDLAQIKQYASGTLFQNKTIRNVLQNDEPFQLIHTDLINNTEDTVFIEILKKDSHGNAIELIESKGSTVYRTYIRKDFFYYEP